MRSGVRLFRPAPPMKHHPRGRDNTDLANPLFNLRNGGLRSQGADRHQTSPRQSMVRADTELSRGEVELEIWMG
jgi:hypothetical protein